MKNIITTIIALIMCLLVMASCSEKEEAEKTNETEKVGVYETRIIDGQNYLLINEPDTTESDEDPEQYMFMGIYFDTIDVFKNSIKKLSFTDEQKKGMKIGRVKRDENGVKMCNPEYFIMPYVPEDSGLEKGKVCWGGEDSYLVHLMHEEKFVGFFENLVNKKAYDGKYYSFVKRFQDRIETKYNGKKVTLEDSKFENYVAYEYEAENEQKHDVIYEYSVGDIKYTLVERYVLQSDDLTQKNNTEKILRIYILFICDETNDLYCFYAMYCSDYDNADDCIRVTKDNITQFTAKKESW